MEGNDLFRRFAVIEQGQPIHFQIIDGKPVGIVRMEREADLIYRDANTIGCAASTGSSLCLRICTDHAREAWNDEKAANNRGAKHGAIAADMFFTCNGYARLGATI